MTVQAPYIRASKLAQKGIDPDAQIAHVRHAKGDIVDYETKPGKGRVAGKRLRVIDALENAMNRGKLTQRQYDASRKVEDLVKRASIAGGRGRDSCCMGEVSGGEQTDESAMNQAQARKDEESLRQRMGALMWSAVCDVSVGDVAIKDWRDSYRIVRRVRQGLDLAADFWKIPAYGAGNSDKS